jgi:hypothetical protein
MTMAEQADNHGHGDVAVDEQQPPNFQLFVWGVVLSVVFFGTALLFNSVFIRYSEKLIHERSLGGQDQELTGLRVLEEKRLSSVGYVDQAKGTVHIPITEGMKKVIEENKR